MLCLAVGVVMGLFLIQPAEAVLDEGSLDTMIPAPLEVPSDGEHLVYQVRWFGFPIGMGEAWIEKVNLPIGGSGWKITAKATSNPFLTRFYPVEDLMESWVTDQTFTVVRSVKNLKEGRYRAHEEIDYDYENRVGRWKSFVNGSEKEIPLSEYSQDPLSAFYWFRMQPMQIGQELNVALIADEKDWTMRLSPLSRQTIDIRGLGSFDTVLVEPKAEFKGALVDRGRVRIYLTADACRIPVRINLKTRYGPVSGILKGMPEGRPTPYAINACASMIKSHDLVLEQ